MHHSVTASFFSNFSILCSEKVFRYRKIADRVNCWDHLYTLTLLRELNHYWSVKWTMKILYITDRITNLLL